MAAVMIDEPANPTEPGWLVWAREIQALAQTGLAFTRDHFVALLVGIPCDRRMQSTAKVFEITLQCGERNPERLEKLIARDRLARL